MAFKLEFNRPSRFYKLKAIVFVALKKKIYIYMGGRTRPGLSFVSNRLAVKRNVRFPPENCDLLNLWYRFDRYEANASTYNNSFQSKLLRLCSPLMLWAVAWICCLNFKSLRVGILRFLPFFLEKGQKLSYGLILIKKQQMSIRITELITNVSV